jgi:vacuolar protein sorting-associated protein 13A/C
VLGLDVLGNPFGVIRGLAEGFSDLFYEPYQGAIQGPEEFAEGLANGVKSLFGHAVGQLMCFDNLQVKFVFQKTT